MLLNLAASAPAQQFLVTQIAVNGAGKPEIRHASDPAYYYILYRVTNVTQIVSAVVMAVSGEVKLARSWRFEIPSSRNGSSSEFTLKSFFLLPTSLPRQSGMRNLHQAKSVPQICGIFKPPDFDRFRTAAHTIG